MASIVPKVLLPYDTYTKLKKASEKPSHEEADTPSEKPTVVATPTVLRRMPSPSKDVEPETLPSTPSVSEDDVSKVQASRGGPTGGGGTPETSSPSAPTASSPHTHSSLMYQYWAPLLEAVKNSSKRAEARQLLRSMANSRIFSVSPYGHLKVGDTPTTIKMQVAFPGLFTPHLSDTREAKRLLALLRKHNLVSRDWSGVAPSPTPSSTTSGEPPSPSPSSNNSKRKKSTTSAAKSSPFKIRR